MLVFFVIILMEFGSAYMFLEAIVIFLHEIQYAKIYSSKQKLLNEIL